MLTCSSPSYSPPSGLPFVPSPAVLLWGDFPVFDCCCSEEAKTSWIVFFGGVGRSDLTCARALTGLCGFWGRVGVDSTLCIRISVEAVKSSDS